MKSVMQEASSIAKAIEQAWISAGQPIEFTVKVLEEPQKNFLGFTTRSAKVALFFDMPTGAKLQPQQQQKSRAPAPRPQQEVVHKKEPEQKQAPQKASKKEVAKPVPSTRREYKPLWNDALLQCVQNWLSDTLKIMNLEQVQFTIEPSEFYLRIQFNKHLISGPAQEKKLFSSFATLILETLKRTFKTSLRGHKIVLMSPAHDNAQP